MIDYLIKSCHQHEFIQITVMFQNLPMITGLGVQLIHRLTLTPLPNEAFQSHTDNSNCDSSYPDVCIPFGPPDLDCTDIPQKRFSVPGSDPHGFDADGDGIGCES
jgi:hypothetical protein